ncbi:hypothetical protein ACEYYA_02405 [Paracoccus sp. p3-h83]|uniref:hypothetical protein n=1 Tax=Paracoccus sp. p3-h83 TaxID=3342805 RepID=UPI0035B9F8D6
MRILSRIRANPDIFWDAMGALAIFLLLVGGLWLAYGVGLPTGGDQLMGRP